MLAYYFSYRGYSRVNPKTSLATIARSRRSAVMAGAIDWLEP